MTLQETKLAGLEPLCTSQAFSNTIISCGYLSFLDFALSKRVLKHFLIHQARNECHVW